MKKEVSYKAVISVTITALVSGFLLSFVFSSFEKDILANNEKTVLEGVKAVIIDSDTIEGPLTENSTFTYYIGCLLYTSPSPRDRQKSRMPSSA